MVGGGELGEAADVEDADDCLVAKAGKAVVMGNADSAGGGDARLAFHASLGQL